MPGTVAGAVKARETRARKVAEKSATAAEAARVAAVDAAIKAKKSRQQAKMKSLALQYGTPSTEEKVTAEKKPRKTAETIQDAISAIGLATEMMASALNKPLGVSGSAHVPFPTAPSGMRSVLIDSAVFDKISAFANERGTDIATLIRVATTTLLKQSRYFDLDTPLSFGKYVGERMEDVIRIDPEWILWAVAETGKICLSGEAQALLDEMIKTVRPSEDD